MRSAIALIISGFVAEILFCLCVVAAPPQQADSERFKPPTLFSRPPNYWGDWTEEKEFDAYDFWVANNKQQHVEGHFAKYLYRVDESHAATSSPLQVMRIRPC